MIISLLDFLLPCETDIMVTMLSSPIYGTLSLKRDSGILGLRNFSALHGQSQQLGKCPTKIFDLDHLQG